MKKLLLYCCIMATTATLSTQETETTNELIFTDEQAQSERTLKALSQFFDFALAKELSLSQELTDLYASIANNSEIDESTINNALEQALQTLELLDSDESVVAIQQQLQQEQTSLSVAQHKAAFAGLQVFDKLTVHTELNTYGPVSINSVDQQPALSVSGQAMIDNLFAGTVDAHTIISSGGSLVVTSITADTITTNSLTTNNATITGTLSGNNANFSGTLSANTIIDTGAAGNVGQVFTVGAGGKLSPSTFAPGGVNSVNPGTGITITGTAMNPIVNLTIPVSIANGGTNATSMTNTNGTVYYDGTRLVTTTTGSLGQVLTSNGAAAPTYQSLSAIGAVTSVTGGTGITITGTATAPVVNLNTPVTVANGGTGNTSLTAHNVLLGEGTANVAFAAPSATSGVPLVSTGSTTDPIFGTASVAGGGTGITSFNANSIVLSGATPTSALTSQTLTNGQLLIGSTGAAPVASTLAAGTGIAITNGAGSITVTAAANVPTTFTEDSGSATPTSNTLKIVGSPTQGIATSGSGNTVTITATNATSTQKGVASFNATNFTVTSGAVSSNPLTITAGTGLTGGGSVNLGGSTTISLSTPVSIANGGTNATSMTNTNGTVYYDGTRLVTTTTGSLGQVLTSNGAAAPTYQTIGASGGVTQLNGDTGSALPTSGIITLNANTNSGKTVLFSGSGSTISLNVTDANNNTTIGKSAGSALSSGTQNTALGVSALRATTTGARNIGIGYSPLSANTSGADNVAVGYLALRTNTTGAQNIAIGSQALQSNTIGGDNTAVGYGALATNLNGNYNTVIGARSLQNNVSGFSNTVCESICLNANTVGFDNIAIGDSVLNSNTSGADNVAIGVEALFSNVTSNYNTAVGSWTLVNSTASPNVAFGYSCLFSNTTGNNNVAVGHETMQFNTLGSDNSAFGRRALRNNTAGGLNTALGEVALASNTSGSANTAVGYGTLVTNGTGNNNTAVGFNSLQNNTTGGNNTAVGYGSLIDNTTGVNNVAVGYQALQLNTVGTNNIALGYQAGNALTSGSNNMYLGNPGLATESNTIRIGAGGTHTAVFMAGVFGSATVGTNQVFINSSGGLSTTTSSQRYKENIVPMRSMHDNLIAMNPVEFTYKKDATKQRQYGLIAEEVEQVDKELVHYNNGSPESVYYQFLAPMLLKGWQEQQAKIVAQENEIKECKESIAELQTKIAMLCTKLELNA
ncbi:MAG: tail fiber domain-containing protein [Candidatus Dependentiae bacterium]|nr:tail fiber domain-containing protein [Candidatus Dependentiae bacterium]